jgi:cell division protease FtsH
MATLGWILLGMLVGVIVGGGVVAYNSKLWYFVRRISKHGPTADERRVAEVIESHFYPLPTIDLTVAERKFPFRMRADLQRSIDSMFGGDIALLQFHGVRSEYSHTALTIADCLDDDSHYPPKLSPPEYEEVDIGETSPMRVLKNGIWLLESGGVRFVVLLSVSLMHGMATGMQFQVASGKIAEASDIAQRFFKILEEAVAKAQSYRGKILSLEEGSRSYLGVSSGITVHKLRHVERDQVILPQKTLELLERNVIAFAQNRRRLAEFGMSTKKGILFYGPPGTGKTHTLHHLARALPGHTTLLIAAEQVGMLEEYMQLARLLAPSIVVIEDVDLIGRNRQDMSSPCEEVMLNKLLNEMDGLKEEADVFFILTTNRPESLEEALASRPGRIDQAIEFPLPDAAGRRKLISLYGGKLPLEVELVEEIVRRTEGVSASFIKELMRRMAQFAIERNGDGAFSGDDLDQALDEMLFKGGVLNRKLLGASDA